MARIEYPPLSHEEVMPNEQAKRLAMAYIIKALCYSYYFTNDNSAYIKDIIDKITQYAILLEVPFTGRSPDKQASFVASTFYEMLISFGPKIPEMLSEMDKDSIIMYNRKVLKDNVSYNDLASMLGEAIGTFWLKCSTKQNNIVAKIIEEISANNGSIHYTDDTGKIRTVTLNDYFENYLEPLSRRLDRSMHNITESDVTNTVYTIVFPINDESGVINVKMPLTEWLLDKANFYFNLPQVFSFKLLVRLLSSVSAEGFIRGQKLKKKIERFISGSSDSRAMQRYREHVQKANRLLGSALTNIGLSAIRPIEQGLKQHVFGKLIVDLAEFGWKQVYHRTGGLFGLFDERRPYEKLYGGGPYPSYSYDTYWSPSKAERMQSLKESTESAYQRIENLIGRYNAEELVNNREMMKRLAQYPAMVDDEKEAFAEEIAKKFNLFDKNNKPDKDKIEKLSQAVHVLLVRTQAIRKEQEKASMKMAQQERKMLDFSSKLQNQPYGLLEQPDSEDTGKKASLPKDVKQYQPEVTLPESTSAKMPDISQLNVSELVKLINATIATSVKEVLLNSEIQKQKLEAVSTPSEKTAESKIDVESLMPAILQKIQSPIVDVLKQYIKSNIDTAVQDTVKNNIDQKIDEVKAGTDKDIDAVKKDIDDLKDQIKRMDSDLDKAKDTSKTDELRKRIDSIAAKVEATADNRLDLAKRRLTRAQRQMADIRGRIERLKRRLGVSELVRRSKLLRAGLKGSRLLRRGLRAGGRVLARGLGVLRGLGAVANIGRLGAMLSNPLGLALGLGALGVSLYAGYKVFSKGILPQLQGKGYELAGSKPEKADEAIKEIMEKQKELGKKAPTIADIRDSNILPISPSAGIGETVARSVRATSGVSIGLGPVVTKPSENLKQILEKRTIQYSGGDQTVQTFAPQAPSVSLPKEPSPQQTQPPPKPSPLTLGSQNVQESLLLSNTEALKKTIGLIQDIYKRLGVIEEEAKKKDVKAPPVSDP